MRRCLGKPVPACWDADGLASPGKGLRAGGAALPRQRRCARCPVLDAAEGRTEPAVAALRRRARDTSAIRFR